MQKKVVITGGSGFIGKNLIERLLQENNLAIYSVSRFSDIAGVENIKVDLTKSDFNFLDDIQPDYIIYLGTVSSPKLAGKDPQGCYTSNVTSVQQFLEKCRQVHSIKKIILFSSIIVYKDITDDLIKESDPINFTNNVYTLSKYFLEQLGQFYREYYNLPVTVFRLSNTYGPHADFEKNPTLIAQLFHQAVYDKKIEVWNTKPIRDWVYVGDVVEVLLRELEINESGLYNLATGKGTSVGEIVDFIKDLTKVQVTVLNKEVDPPFQIICDTEKLQDHIGFVPATPLEKGLRLTYQFYAKEKEVGKK